MFLYPKKSKPNMGKKYTTLFLDFDGTLTDSGEGIMKCVQYTLEHFGIHVEDYHDLRKFVGPPIEDSYREYYHFTDEMVQEAIKTYHKRYFPTGIYEQHAYPRVFEFLEEVKRRGYTTAVATSRTKEQAERISTEIVKGLRENLDYIFGRDQEGRLHTKADVINDAIGKMRITDRSKVLMIGDTKYDIIGAKKCSLDSLGVLWGYGSKDELEEAGADYLCESFENILEIL